MIEIKNISFSYGKSDVVQDVSFNAYPGECIGILGNNGSGKSTLITCINRILKPKSGVVYINNQDVHKMKRAQAARSISYVAQKNEIGLMTVFDTVLMGRKPYIKWAISQNDLDICEKTLTQMGMGGYKLRYVNELSGGELQKVMLARALVQQPKLMLLDEPTSNLDPKSQYEMMALVRKLAREHSISIIVVLHDVSLALRYCDKFLFMKKGRVHKFGDEAIVTQETIFDVYGVNSTIAKVGGRKVVVIG